MTETKTINITYYSDILCIWAYCAQARVDEIKHNFADQVEMDYRYISVFGHTESKIGGGWKDRGGFEGYNAHVQNVADNFAHVNIHPELWSKARPASSASPHEFLKAVQLVSGNATFEQLTWSLRKAFFEEARDIADRDVLWTIAEQHALDLAALKAVLKRGHAMAALMADYNHQRDNDIKVSPSIFLNEGRQALLGNVGYKVIEANIQEMIRTQNMNNTEMASWC